MSEVLYHIPPLLSNKRKETDGISRRFLIRSYLLFSIRSSFALLAQQNRPLCYRGLNTGEPTPCVKKAERAFALSAFLIRVIPTQ